MNIALKLTPAQQAWIEAAVARGDFATPEEALTSIVDCGIHGLEVAPADSMTDEEVVEVRSLLADAEISIANGQALTIDEHRRRMAATLAALKS